tara:strand:+ start:704 stop:1072 length:369 start_codon:yes stop_codon:yes gene_type:complete
MKNYKHNYKKNRYRGNGDKSFKRNGSNHTFEENFSVITEFRRNKPSRNNNASRLIEKYTTLAKEALSSGDKILSENYFQHADHFIRISDQKNTEKEYKKSQENSKVSTSPENETENLNTETS